MANGLFITIEGPDGAGKTTVLNELFPRLQMIAKKEIIRACIVFFTFLRKG